MNLSKRTLSSLPESILVQTFGQISDVLWKCEMILVHPKWQKLIKHRSKNAWRANKALKLVTVGDEISVVEGTKESERINIEHIFDKLIPCFYEIRSLSLDFEKFWHVSMFLEHLKTRTPSNIKLRHLCFDNPSFHYNATLFGELVTQHSQTLQRFSTNLICDQTTQLLPELQECSNLRQIDRINFSIDRNYPKQMNMLTQFLLDRGEIIHNLHIDIEMDFAESGNCLWSILQSLPSNARGTIELKIDEYGNGLQDDAFQLTHNAFMHENCNLSGITRLLIGNLFELSTPASQQQFTRKLDQILTMINKCGPRLNILELAFCSRSSLCETIECSADILVFCTSLIESDRFPGSAHLIALIPIIKKERRILAAQQNWLEEHLSKTCAKRVTVTAVEVGECTEHFMIKF